MIFFNNTGTRFTGMIQLWIVPGRNKNTCQLQLPRNHNKTRYGLQFATWWFAKNCIWVTKYILLARYHDWSDYWFLLNLYSFQLAETSATYSHFHGDQSHRKFQVSRCGTWLPAAWSYMSLHFFFHQGELSFMHMCIKRITYNYMYINYIYIYMQCI